MTVGAADEWLTSAAQVALISFLLASKRRRKATHLEEENVDEEEEDFACLLLLVNRRSKAFGLAGEDVCCEEETVDMADFVNSSLLGL